MSKQDAPIKIICKLRIGSSNPPYFINVQTSPFVGSVANAGSKENHSPWEDENKALSPVVTGSCMTAYRKLPACKGVLILLIIIKKKWGGREGGLKDLYVERLRGDVSSIRKDKNNDGRKRTIDRTIWKTTEGGNWEKVDGIKLSKDGRNLEESEDSGNVNPY